MEKIILAGGSGYLGMVLSQYFKASVKQIVILSREHKPDIGNIRTVAWDGKTIGPWTKELEGADAVINLTGKSVDCRYTEENKKRIYSSRLDSTNVLGRAIDACVNPPKVWINSSSATIYRASYDKLMTEDTGETGSDFSMDVCKQWEKEFNNNAIARDTRKVIIRTAIVLGNNGGALPPLKNLVRARFNKRLGDGNQYFSWLHEYDFCRIVEWLLMTYNAEGVYNVSSPNPLPNKDFMKVLRESLHVSFGFPLPTWLLTLGAVLIQTETELVLKSRKVFPQRLLDSGFKFEYPDLRDALKNLIPD